MFGRPDTQFFSRDSNGIADNRVFHEGTKPPMKIVNKNNVRPFSPTAVFSTQSWHGRNKGDIGHIFQRWRRNKCRATADLKGKENLQTAFQFRRKANPDEVPFSLHYTAAQLVDWVAVGVNPIKPGPYTELRNQLVCKCDDTLAAHDA